MELVVWIKNQAEIELTFNFFPVDENPYVPKGSLVQVGTYTLSGFELQGRNWINQPSPLWGLVGLKASFDGAGTKKIRGEITSDSGACQEFSVNKISTKTHEPPI